MKNWEFSHNSGINFVFLRNIIMKYWIFLTALFFISQVNAQGKVEIIVDPDVEQTENERTERRIEQGGKVQGYRIMTGFFSSRSSADNEYSLVKSYFSNVYGSALLQFDEPNFKVYIGEFTTKNEAEAALHEVKKKFPSARLVKDVVSYTPSNSAPTE